jgi:hypothetical protein
MTTIQEDCFYYIESGVLLEEARIRAACVECKLQNKIPGDPMFWPGKVKGYGDYDLYCSLCNRPINVRKKDDNTSTV